METIALRLYSALMWLAQPLLRRKLARRGKAEPGYLAHVEERFGTYTQPAETASELVWVHAVSLGETRAAAVLLKALRLQQPGLRVLLTHGTATGRAEGLALLQPGDVQVWQPWDSVAAVERFFTHFKPRLGLLMETEIWPNAVAAATRHRVPLVLVNARLSDKSLQQAEAMSPLSHPAYGALTGVYAQTQDDAMRFAQLGASVAGVFGNLKFDAAPDPQQLATGQAWRDALARPVLMFASSREGEEEALLQQLAAWRDQASPADAPGAGDTRRLPWQVLVVPRHPQRFDAVAALAESHGFSVSRRSGWPADGPVDDAASEADIWLGDSLGEMALYYAMSDGALLGGSFAELGGQNLIEAAACGCPVIMGPHTFNFAEAAELAEAAGAARRTADLADALQVASQLLQDAGDPAPARSAMVASALDFAARNRGATARTVEALSPWF
ncbi:MAG: 3-deoxy-D-manno-octulosonic acid transferase [Polaromonas sp.]|nr:3-deoxy-D-manno-octulosonic acid transferase [Polaromonas sp.]